MLTIISGTNRPNSSTRKVVTHLEGVYAALNQPFQVLELQDMPQEAFLPTSYAVKPASLTPLTDKVLQASGIVLVSPEYNGSIPGVLKYFIDLLPFPKSFEGRPVCFVGVAAGVWGALRPIEQLQMIFGYRNAFIYPDRVFIPQCTKVIDTQGHISDAEIVKRLEIQAAGFARFVQTLEPIRAR